MPNWQMSLSKLQEKIWHGRLPLEIRLAPSECRTYDMCDPYLVSRSSPRLIAIEAEVPLSSSFSIKAFALDQKMRESPRCLLFFQCRRRGGNG
jgi:autophagy-related protein 5